MQVLETVADANSKAKGHLYAFALILHGLLVRALQGVRQVGRYEAALLLYVVK